MFDRHLKVWPRNVPHHITIPQTNVAYNLEVTATRFPDHPAIIFYGRTLTYAELRDRVERLAGYLQRRLGVAKGDRVLLYMQNSPHFVIAFQAILRADAVVVPVNPMNRTAELEHYVKDTGAKVAICGQELLSQMAPLAGTASLERVISAAYADLADSAYDLPVPEAVQMPPIERFDTPAVIPWAETMQAGEAPASYRAGPDDWAVLPYSSGTTAAPKGCLHTHRSVMATLVGSVLWRPGQANGAALITLPMFHVTGMQGGMNACIYSGTTMVIMTRWDRRTAAELIQRHRVTGWTSITTMAIDLVSDPEIRKYDLSSLEMIGGGGAAMPEPVAAKLKELTGLDYIEGYGLSETMAATHINPTEAPKRQCLGIPVFDVDARVVDVETKQPLGSGQVGEIVMRGPQIFQGYWNNPAATEAAFLTLDGERFFRTGDLGYYDEDGYFFIVDRVKRMINASGFKVWPTEVEALMHRHPAVSEVCVVSAPDARRGETVKAYIVPTQEARGKVTEEEIAAWCAETMAAYKCPRIVTFVESLPRSGTGKLNWRALQEREWA
ncbi:long-chain fatty acid--CoA ligase [Indioceanicola profundi]|uniref:long-chain fatty acid--CoA ligase n=1 Tax=Indioceanicola profundi TaxID=2220096 RepID=UPI000E6AAAEB|nr:long-chain fatty acid--CoA ligase [Indioceanicola profundi]